MSEGPGIPGIWGIDSVGVKIRADGSIKLDPDHIYWSEASAALAGSWVTLMLPRRGADHAIVRLPSGEIRLDRVEDVAFAERAAVQRLIDRAKTSRPRPKLSRQLKVQALVDLIDQRIQANSDKAAATRQSGVALGARYINCKLRGAFRQLFGRDDMAEQQLLDREDVVLQLGDIIFGHGIVPPSEKPIDEAGAAHRLSGGAK